MKACRAAGVGKLGGVAGALLMLGMSEREHGVRQVACDGKGVWQTGLDIGFQKKDERVPRSGVYQEFQSGSKYTQLIPGRAGGREAVEGVVVGIHFEGYSLGGQLLESTWAQGRPSWRMHFKFRLGDGQHHGIPPAVEEALLGMVEGERREIIAVPWMLLEAPSQWTTKGGMAALMERRKEVRIYSLSLYSVVDPDETQKEEGRPDKAEGKYSPQ